MTTHTHAKGEQLEIFLFLGLPAVVCGAGSELCSHWFLVCQRTLDTGSMEGDLGMSEMTQEVFLKDVSKHQMSVLLDHGIHRCLRFKEPGTSVGWFDVVTWPGFLAYTGDMGSFVFTRLDDMFQFFRDGRDDGKLHINLSYWGEKLEAVDSRTHHPGYRQFSPERLRKKITEVVDKWCEELSQGEAERFRYEVRSEVISRIDDGEHEARMAVRDFSYKSNSSKFQFVDSWEWDCEEYTFRFIWCCYAIAWAIRTYDHARVPA